MTAPSPERAKAEHDRLMRDDPVYRASYEHVSRVWGELTTPSPERWDDDYKFGALFYGGGRQLEITSPHQEWLDWALNALYAAAVREAADKRTAS